MTIAEIMDEVVKICREYKVREAFLFGSRAKGTETERSDIDVAIAGCEDFEGLREALDDIPTLYSFDVVNMETCMNQLLLEDIRQYGRKIL